MRPFSSIALTVAACLVAGTVSAAEVNVYSARKDHLLKPVLDSFTKETGIAVNLLSADAPQLLERLKSEGKDSPADLFVTTNVATCMPPASPASWPQ